MDFTKEEIAWHDVCNEVYPFAMIARGIKGDGEGRMNISDSDIKAFDERLPVLVENWKKFKTVYAENRKD